MIETVVVATDGSESVQRAINVAVDLAERFDAEVHALYVIDETDVEGSPDELRDDLRDALERSAEDAFETVRESTDREIYTALREGQPAKEVCEYGRHVDADVIATGTRGRHGEHRFLLGSVAERIVRSSPIPVLTVRQLG